MKIKKGFTLAEVMISLAIVGILAALVTPTIVGLRPNKNKMMVKKAYYTTENIVSSLINDSYLYKDLTYECQIEDWENCAYGFDYEDEVTYDGESFSGDEKFQRLFAARLNLNSYESDYSEFITADGIQWFFDGTDLSGSEKAINEGWQTSTTSKIAPADNVRLLVIDVNGADEPNCRESACSSGTKIDRFAIEIQSNGKMKISDNDPTAKDYITINANLTD